MSHRRLHLLGKLCAACFISLLCGALEGENPLGSLIVHSAEVANNSNAHSSDVQKRALQKPDLQKTDGQKTAAQNTAAQKNTGTQNASMQKADGQKTAAAKTSGRQPDQAIPVFDDICFDDFGFQRPHPGVGQLQELLGQVPGLPYTFQLQHEHNRMLVQLRGMYQLRPRWQEGSLLRMSVVTYRPLRMYLWRGQQGVAILYYPNVNHTWMAYGVTRKGGNPQPDSYALWGCDGWRYQQSWGGTVLLLYRDGMLHLMRGDLPLLSVPCPEPPQETYLDIEGMVRGLEMLVCRGGPAKQRPPRVVLDVDKPAQAEWKLTAGKGVSFDKAPDGAAELAASERSEGGYALLHLGEPAWRELVFLVDEADPGTGLCFADANGKPFLRLAFLREVTGNRLSMSFWDVGNNAIEHWADIQNTLSPCAGKPQWIKVLPGVRCWRLAVSGDGQHWSYFPTPLNGPRPQCVYAGLYVAPGEPKRKIRLRTLQVHLLEGLHAATPPEPQSRFSRYPPGAEDSHKLLAALGEFVLRPLDVELRLKALEEAALVLDGREGEMAEDIAALYARLGRSLLAEKFDRPFSALSASLMRAPISQHEYEAVKLPELLLGEMIPLMYLNDRQQIARLCSRIRLWQGHRRRSGSLPDEEQMLAHISDWAASMVRLEGLPSGYIPRGSAGDLRPLAMPQISREGYTIVADLQAAVQGQALKDACQIILAQTDPFAFGLTPDSNDHRLLVAVPTAIRVFFQRNPALQRAMSESFGPVGRMRLQEAMRKGDSNAVQAVAAAFHGTEVAVEAYQWLGDRAMATGQFTQAIGAYRQALFGATAPQWHAITARARLAGAMTGRDLGRAVSQLVKIGSAEFTPEQFEAMIDNLRRHRQAGVAASHGAITAVPPPKQYRLVPLGKLEGKDVAAPSGNTANIDWAARQVCVTVAGQHILVGDRSELSCFALADGKLLWRQKLQPDRGQQLWPHVPLRPAATKDAVYLRRLTRNGPELVALNLADGKLLWTFNSAGAVVCDPLLLGHELFVLTTRPVYPQKLLLSFCRVDVLTGEIVAQRSLCEFRDPWRGLLPLQATLANDRLVVVGGGCVMSVDLAGHCLWLRQPVWIPPYKDDDDETITSARFAQALQPPMIFGDLVVAMQPGMRSIECLDLYTGQLVWYEPLARLARPLGLAGDQLIVESSDSLLSFDVRTGKKLWQQPLRAAVAAHLCGTDGLVIATREDQSESRRSKAPVLKWLDLRDGAVLHQCRLDLPERELVGPLVAADQRFWLGHASPEQPAARTIAELVVAQ